MFQTCQEPNALSLLQAGKMDLVINVPDSMAPWRIQPRKGILSMFERHLLRKLGPNRWLSHATEQAFTA